jgi:hypothetical protein
MMDEEDRSNDDDNDHGIFLQYMFQMRSLER